MYRQAKAGRLGILAAASIALAASAQTTLIDEDFETPDVGDNTANPAFVGWTWISNVKNQDSPGDGAPGASGNQVIHFEYTDDIARYDTAHTWSAGETYVVEFHASPQSWEGTTTRYIIARIRETDGDLLWESGNVLMPKYDDYGGNAYTARQRFTFVVSSDDFVGGTAGTAVRLEIQSSGSRGVYVDNVLFEVGALGADITAPTPDALTWSSVPVLVDNTNTTMTCTFATDDFPYGVQHYFENTNTGVNSGWQDGVDGHAWGEYNVAAGSTNSYRAKARDKSPGANETGFTPVQQVIALGIDTTPPTPDPMTWSVEPMVVDSLNTYMVATTATDARYGVEYFFENTTTGIDSGWQSSPIWYQQYQDYDTPLTYRVKARDTSPPRTNETDWSANGVVTIPTPEDGLLVDASFQIPSYNDGQNNPWYVGWTWDVGSCVWAQKSSGSGVPGASSNRVIELNRQGPPPEATYETDHEWSANFLYTLTINSAPNSWSGSSQRYLDATLHQTDSTELWTTNVAVPLYDSFAGANPWPEELTFTFEVDGSDFVAGSEGETLALTVTYTGTRSLYIDNIHLTATMSAASGSVFRFR